MSYCRFSTDDFQCDLYCYEDCSGGFTTHVAANRAVFKEPLPPKVPFEMDRLAEWIERHDKVIKIIHESDRVMIDLPHAGEHFNDATIEEFRDRLIYLRGLGYQFPFDIIEEITLENL